MAATPRPVRRARGEIEQLPSGSLRVRVYAGLDPESRKRRYLVETVPAGPKAAQRAEKVRARLLEQARRESSPAAEAVRYPPGRRGRRRGELTIATVARLAGVSAPTVSKVLNGRSGVAAATRQRVEALLREHGYQRPEMVAPAASVEVVFYGMQSSLAIEIMQGVERIVGQRRLAVGFTDVLRLAAMGRSWAEDLLARRPTGVITVHFGVDPEQHALLAASAIPMVALDPTGEPLHAVPSVGATNWSGGIAATRHLLELGHRRIAVITGPEQRLCAKARLEGARAALQAAGVGLDDRLVRPGMFTFDDGLNHGRALLGLATPPTAVLCGNDLQALGVYEAARQAGVRIPEALSVVGFDDIPHARWCGPRLTTVRQPLVEMGSAAATLLLSLAAGDTPTQTRIEVATTLVVRDSTAPPGR
ncbi:MAG TPA: substrate-binding domain-containing protein [Rugosimonospora sp.]|nr:substrate-binding domain-containing protein [Rugosimonospora sp.]